MKIILEKQCLLLFMHDSKRSQGWGVMATIVSSFLPRP